MSFLSRIFQGREPERDQYPVSFDEWLGLVQQFSYQGVQYSTGTSPQESIAGNFTQLAQLAYMSDSVVFACMAVRASIFTEARFQFRQKRTGGPGKLFGTADLVPLEEPWPGATTGDLLARAITYADLAGNAFFLRDGKYIRCLRPDWVTLILGSYTDSDGAAWDPSADVIGYEYQPGGPGSGRDPILYAADEVAHFAPIPDPMAQFRGMSWLTPVIREVMADKAATDHKLRFFDNAATPQMVVKLDTPDMDKYKQYIDLFRSKSEGADNAYKTLFLAAGADATVVGANLQQLEFKATQGAGETRIAAAAQVPPVIVGLSEGLASATYSNYGMARRRLADGTMRPLWRNFCGSIARIIQVPPQSELWYDESQIAFLKEDQMDAAKIQQTEASTLGSLITAGFTADSAVQAVLASDWSVLEHTGLTSVQLVPPGTPGEPTDSDVAGPDEPPVSPPSAAPATPSQDGANSVREDEIDRMLTRLLAETTQPQRPQEFHITVPPSTVEISEGAISSHVTLEMPAQEASRVEFGEGAFTSHVSVEPSRTEIAVEPAATTIEPGAFQLSVQQPDVRSDVHFEAGAIASSVTMEPAEVGEVSVNVEPARMELAPGAIAVSVEPTDVQVDVAAAEVTVEPARVELQEGAIQVSVEPTEMRVDVAPTEVTVERADTQIVVEPTPVEIINEVNVQQPNKTITFARDVSGNIVEATSEDAEDAPEDD